MSSKDLSMVGSPLAPLSATDSDAPPVGPPPNANPPSHYAQVPAPDPFTILMNSVQVMANNQIHLQTLFNQLGQTQVGSMA